METCLIDKQRPRKRDWNNQCWNLDAVVVQMTGGLFMKQTKKESVRQASPIGGPKLHASACETRGKMHIRNHKTSMKMLQ